MNCNLKLEHKGVCCCGMELKKCTYKKYNTCSKNRLKIFWYRLKTKLKI